ncbi:DgyrCDS9588 [Dimorphilus gyrociliatus]|uniref:DgyrCDS9588 n=1 Tax=Dimorphilus gyrociliatus TaxID=2664684 RepID=A0A7I8VZ25_9ANNE|nr:DgyrCDS9588 [Dimorphilus gyrociliatus]
MTCNRKASRLAEVGLLEAPRLQEKYETGQLFLHRIFGYRGVIIFPWVGKVFDRDLATKGDVASDLRKGNDLADKSSVSPPKDVKGRTHTYYQVLIDTRDMSHIRVGTESVTFLSSQDSRGTLYSIPGLDYVSHEDILPYQSTETSPIENHLFERFLKKTSPESHIWSATDTLREWQRKNHPWLELTDVHKETTENMRVTVMPFYIGSREVQQTYVYWWRYCIRLEKLGTGNVQLRERHWRIFSLSGTLETVRGRGIVGKEPVFTKTQPAFQYTSHISLQAPSGHMWGTFKMEREDGSSFECRIPPFSLESKNVDPLTTSPNPHELS